jgi:hypothetical protein
MGSTSLASTADRDPSNIRDWHSLDRRQNRLNTG